MGNTVGSKLVFMPLRLSKKQRDILIGTILGDASIESCKKEDRIQINHSDKQKEYVFWKYQHLKEWTLSPPRRIGYKDKRIGKINWGWRFRTFSHPEFTQYKKIFYSGRKKIIPRNIKDLLVSPLSLAVWYMDDGKKRPDCRGAYLDTICFSKEEQTRLIDCLRNNFQLVNTKLHWNSDGYHIYIPYVSIDRFKELIKDFVIPSLAYKLPYTRNDFLPKRQKMVVKNPS